MHMVLWAGSGQRHRPSPSPSSSSASDRSRSSMQCCWIRFGSAFKIDGHFGEFLCRVCVNFVVKVDSSAKVEQPLNWSFYACV